MKKIVAKRLQGLIAQAAKEKGVESNKRMYRGVKKFYLRQNGGKRAEMMG